MWNLGFSTRIFRLSAVIILKYKLLVHIISWQELVGSACFNSAERNRLIARAIMEKILSADSWEGHKGF